MSGDDKTEEPTEKKLRDEYKRGNVPQSREVSTFTAIVAMFVVITIIMPGSTGKFMETLIPFMDSPDDIPVSTFGDTLAVAMWTAKAVAGAFILFAASTFALGLVGAIAQGRIVFTTERIMPKLHKISPLAGVQRLVSMGNLVEFIKGIAKILAVCGISAVILIPHIKDADRMVGLPPETIAPAVVALCAKLLGGILVFSGCVAVFDRFWKRHEWRKKVMMTKQQVKDEYKQNDGDPALKAKRRDRARMVIRSQMMAKVPTATFIVTNPTHFAVALRYRPGKDAAPVCVAKGIDTVAFKIKELALRKKIPVIENPPLARALHATSELDKTVPEEHFEAVARVVTFVMALKDKSATVRMPGVGD